MAREKNTRTPLRKKTETPPSPRVRRAERRATRPAADDGHHAPAALKGPATPGGKLGVIIAMMRRPEGATVAQMSVATDWLPHSVRGALAGAVKKKHCLTVTSEKTEGGRIYRIQPAESGAGGGVRKAPAGDATPSLPEPVGA